MQALIAGIAALLVGIALGLWLRAFSAKAEKAQLERRAEELSVELTGVRTDLARTQAESAARAGFESLAVERLSVLSERNTQMDGISRQLVEKDSEILRLTGQNSKLETDLANERGNGERLTQQFQLLANDILKENSKTFTEQNQTSLSALLNPLNRDLNEFRAKVEEAKTESLVGRTQLSEKLEQLSSLNERLSTEAQALANALTRDTSKQGHWGELVLLDILEACDLKRGLHYTYQQTFIADGEDGLREERKITDVILRFPEGRSLIIDSKVTLSAHKDYVNATDDATRKNALDRLVTSIRSHIRELAAKNYQELLGERSPDYVVLFAPNEAAYLLAVQADSKLITDGYKSRVLIAGPTTILHIARIVDSLWRNEDRSKSLQQIGERARLLYEEFTRFVDSLETVRTSILKAAAEIHNAEQSHDEAMKRLTSGRGNLVSQSEKLGRLGNKSAKQIATRVLEMSEEETESSLSLAAESDDSGA